MEVNELRIGNLVSQNNFFGYVYSIESAEPRKEVNWEITQKQLLEDYQPKVMKDISDGKIQYGKHEFGQTEWIEKI